MIQTAFQLPFRVVHPVEKFFSAGGEVQFMLEFSTNLTSAQVAWIDSLIQLFADFAGTGALSGRRFAPHRSGIDRSPIAMRPPRVCVWTLSNCCIDDAAIVVLCDMLMRESVALPLRSFAVSNGGKEVELVQDTDSWSSYPARYAPLPFEVADQEPESGAYTFTLALAEPLKSSARDTLTAWLRLWTRCVLAGGYALAPVEPKHNYVEPDDSVVDFSTTVEWSVFKLRAHPAAVDALVNLLACFSQKVQRVLLLTIQ